MMLEVVPDIARQDEDRLEQGWDGGAGDGVLLFLALDRAVLAYDPGVLNGDVPGAVRDDPIKQELVPDAEPGQQPCGGEIEGDARRDRVYLPADELARFGVTTQDILESRASEAFTSLMRFQAERARSYYELAYSKLAAEDRSRQRAGLIMAAIYRTLLDEIERDGFRVLDRRVALTPLRKLWIAWRTSVKVR